MLLAVLALGFAGPAQASPDMPARFERLRSQDLRVAGVAYRLAIANAARCEGMRVAQFGFVLHSIDQYGLADRNDAARSFGLGQQVGVMAVVAGSPAERAGLVSGDSLIAVNGRMLPTINAGVAPTRASVNRAQALLTEEMARGPVSLLVSGAGGERTVRFAAAVGCQANVELVPGSAVNAWADGTRVIISEGLLAHCASDAELALVIGHEMAHNLLHHRQRLAAAGVTADRLLLLTASEAIVSRETEEEADGLAVKLAAGAGYDLSVAEAFIGGLMDVETAAATHPARDRRLALLHTAISATRE